LLSCSLNRWLVGELENARESCGVVSAGRQVKDSCKVTGMVNWSLAQKWRLERMREGCRIKLIAAHTTMEAIN
jgi:hypothetical protein